MMNNLNRLLNNKNFAFVIQFVKFGIVGVSNTLISYGIEMLCYYLLFVNSKFTSTANLLKLFGVTASSSTLKIVYTTIIAFVISVTNSYYWNNRYVFSSGNKLFFEHLRSYLKTFLCYSITGIVISQIIKVVFTNLGIKYYISSILALVITIPLNFILNKFWAFRSKKPDVKEENQ